MTYAYRFAAFLLLGFLAACEQGDGGSKGHLSTTQQGNATYTPLTSTDRADAPGARDAANQTFSAPVASKNSGVGDSRATDTFQYYFVKAVQEAKPQRQVAVGNGASLSTAFFAHDVPERLGLQSPMNDLLARYPDRHDVSGELLRGTNRKYVLRVTFRSGHGPGELYYDVSRWIGYTANHG